MIQWADRLSLYRQRTKEEGQTRERCALLLKFSSEVKASDVRFTSGT